MNEPSLVVRCSFERKYLFSKSNGLMYHCSAPAELPIDNNGAMIHPNADAPDPALVDRDVMLYGAKSGFGVKGARIGSAAGEAKLFRDDMLVFWKRVLGNP